MGVAQRNEFFSSVSIADFFSHPSGANPPDFPLANFMFAAVQKAQVIQFNATFCCRIFSAVFRLVYDYEMRQRAEDKSLCQKRAVKNMPTLAQYFSNKIELAPGLYKRSNAQKSLFGNPFDYPFGVFFFFVSLLLTLEQLRRDDLDIIPDVGHIADRLRFAVPRVNRM